MRGHRILVADADNDSANALVRLLAVQGHDVRTVTDPKQALIASISFCPELVILDVTGPGCQGLETARALHRRAHGVGSRVLLLALTPRCDPSLHDDAHAAGFDLVVPKAVDGAYLCDLVRGLIDTTALDARPGDPLDRALFSGTPLH